MEVLIAHRATICMHPAIYLVTANYRKSIAPKEKGSRETSCMQHLTGDESPC